MNKMKAFIAIIISLFIFADSVLAQTEQVDISQIKNIALPLHITELLLALFICYMSLKFFRITKPVNLFLIIYTAIGFLIINILLYLLFYSSFAQALSLHFVAVYFGSRIALIGMLASFVLLFYQWNRIMRQTEKK